jgi:ubiquinone/menaquinone biosynthesis C-methylase UbiE
MQFDFSFDKRVAQRYNAQRAHPPAVSAEIGRAIAALTVPNARVLEIGVGTGRIAAPVVQAGCRVVGFDLSADMLGEVQQPNLTVFQGDMHALPLADDCFDAALAVHVLHLAHDWQRVLTATTRVLRPDGVFIQGDDWIDPDSVMGRLRDELRQRAIAMSPNMKPPAAGVSKKQFLAELGGTEQTECIAAEWETAISPAERLAMIENRMDNESWFLPEPLFNNLFTQLKAYAADTWTDLDKPQPVKRRFVLKITRGHWS